MIFNSVSYLLFFPIVTILYFAFPKKLRNAWLLIASYFFYMNWNAVYGLLLFSSTVITYLCSLLVEWAKVKKQSIKLAKAAMAVSFLLNLGLLFYFKYLNFAIVNLNRISSLFHGRQISAFDILLPVGISFYIFQALGYTMDVYRGKIKACRNFFRYALFVSFFPQLVAGPIERSDNLLPQFEEEHTFDTDRIREGLLWMLWGLFLKIVIADNLSVYITEIYDNYLAYTGAEIVFATVLFAFQIYCDFGGYSYIAIGSAKVLGFRLMDNFKAPYLAVSVHDFWRRWHISLTSWFTDYLYIPLGGNRKGKLRKYLNVMIVFLVSGLWHGADWTYVIWGGINGLYMVIEEVTGYRKKAGQLAEKSLSYRIFAGILTFALVDFSWLFFRASSLDDVVGMLRQIKAVPGFHRLFGAVFVGMEPSLLLAVTLALLLMWQVDRLLYRGKNAAMLVLSQGWFARYLVYGGLLLFILLFGVYGYEYAQTAFIYFQF